MKVVPVSIVLASTLLIGCDAHGRGTETKLEIQPTQRQAEWSPPRPLYGFPLDIQVESPGVPSDIQQPSPPIPPGTPSPSGLFTDLLKDAK